jgi:general L-amino acid transport system substrate-binding protein
MAAAVLLLSAAAAHAGVLETVRHDGVLYCGAEPRSGVAEDRGDGTLGGVAVDRCRDVAVAILGPRAKIGFRLYQSPNDFAALRDGPDELAFLTPASIAEQGLAGALVGGPTVFTVRLSLLVASAAPTRRPEDLAGHPICFMIASDAQHALDAAFRGWKLDLLHMGYEEEDEMDDAYAVRRCTAIAGEAGELAQVTTGAGVNRLDSRILPQPLASFPVTAETRAGDPAFSAMVRRVLGR